MVCVMAVKDIACSSILCGVWFPEWIGNLLLFFFFFTKHPFNLQLDNEIEVKKREQLSTTPSVLSRQLTCLYLFFFFFYCPFIEILTYWDSFSKNHPKKGKRTGADQNGYFPFLRHFEVADVFTVRMNEASCAEVVFQNEPLIHSEKRHYLLPTLLLRKAIIIKNNTRIFYLFRNLFLLFS